MGPGQDPSGAGASILPADRVSALSICIVRDHHERWDGDGYEQGRAEDEIHQFARIAAVADVYDAVTADRPYKPATAPHVGVKVIREGVGTQVDPDRPEHPVIRHCDPSGAIVQREVHIVDGAICTDMQTA